MSILDILFYGNCILLVGFMVHQGYMAIILTKDARLGNSNGVIGSLKGVYLTRIVENLVFIFALSAAAFSWPRMAIMTLLMFGLAVQLIMTFAVTRMMIELKEDDDDHNR